MGCLEPGGIYRGGTIRWLPAAKYCCFAVWRTIGLGTGS